MITNKLAATGCQHSVFMFMDWLDKTYPHIKFTITSALRNGTGTSSHNIGLALDIKAEDIHPFKLAAMFMDYPEYQGVGVNIFKLFVHVDLDTNKGRRYWTYDRDGNPV